MALRIYCPNWNKHKGSQAWTWICLRTWYSTPSTAMVFLHAYVSLLLGVMWAFVGAKDHFTTHNGKGVRHYMADAHTTWWFFARWMKPVLAPLSAQRNFYSSCTSLRFTAVGSHSGPAAPIASLLMDLCIGFSTACVLMHMMRSSMSRWAVGHNTTRRF